MQGLSNYQAIERAEEGYEQVKIEDKVKWNRAGLAIVITVLIVCSGITVYSGRLPAHNMIETSLAIAAVVTPGSPMSNGDELWSCKKVSIDREADCVVDLKQQPDFKMVFYRANIYCYARVNAIDDKSWAVVFSQLAAGKNVAKWGTPYWIMDQDYPFKDPKTGLLTKIDSVALFKGGKGATKLAYVTKDVKSPDTGKNYDGSYVVMRGNKLDNSGNPIVGQFTDMLALVPKIKGPITWGCDQVAFQLAPDGNLLLSPYQSQSKIQELKKKFGGSGLVDCGPIMFATGTYGDIRKARPELNLKPLAG